jgi:hypothetical protein
LRRRAGLASPTTPTRNVVCWNVGNFYVALTRARDSVWLARLNPVNEDADA